MHGLFSVLAGCSSDSSEDSTYSLKEQCKSTTRTSKPCSPAFKGVETGTRGSSHSHSGFHSVQFSVILMCQLLTYANKTVTGLCQIKGV